MRLSSRSAGTISNQSAPIDSHNADNIFVVETCEVKILLIEIFAISALS